MDDSSDPIPEPEVPPPPAPDHPEEQVAREPAAESVLGERLSRRVVAYWYLADLVRAATLVAIALFVRETWLSGPGKDVPDWVPSLVLAAVGLFVAWTLVWPPLAYRTWRFSVDDDYLALRHGVVFVEERRIPVPRMQHVDLVRGPIERLFSLATLVVFTAGNEGSAFRVPGLSVQRAEELRDRVLLARGRDGV